MQKEWQNMPGLVAWAQKSSFPEGVAAAHARAYIMRPGVSYLHNTKSANTKSATPNLENCHHTVFPKRRDSARGMAQAARLATAAAGGAIVALAHDAKCTVEASSKEVVLRTMHLPEEDERDTLKDVF